MISAIVAVDKNWGIGFNGDLLEHIPEDLKRFKELTAGHVVIMGRKTWDSLPKKPLPDRLNLIVSNQPREVLERLSVRISFEEAKARALAIENDEEWFIIGGGIIYEKFLPFCDRIYVTKIYKEHDNVDTYFPNLDEMDEWVIEADSEEQTYYDLEYRFYKYVRKK